MAGIEYLLQGPAGAAGATGAQGATGPAGSGVKFAKTITKNGASDTSVIASTTVYSDVDNTTFDTVVPCATGDEVLFTLSGAWTGTSATLQGQLDIVTVVSGTRTNSLSGTNTMTGTPSAAFGVFGWVGPAGSVRTVIGGGALYKVVAGDIVAGNVTFRLIGASNGSTPSRTIFSSGGVPLILSVINLGISVN